MIGRFFANFLCNSREKCSQLFNSELYLQNFKDKLCCTLVCHVGCIPTGAGEGVTPGDARSRVSSKGRLPLCGHNANDFAEGRPSGSDFQTLMIQTL